MSGLTLSFRIDVQSLLDPIPGPRPVGESLRYEGTYDRIRDARSQDDPALSQGIYKAQLKRADWVADEAICVDALEHRTKDLQIAGWLLEAWLRLYGFSGVEAGLKLLTGLCENFWADLYPALDGEEVEDRIAPIEWINQKLALGLKQIPLTLPRESGEESYSYADWEKACHLENQARKDPGMSEAALANLKPSVAAFRAGLISTDRSFYADLAKELDGALNNCKQLQLLLDARCGKSSPSLHQFNEALRTIQQLVNESLAVRETSVAPEPAPPAPAPVHEEIEVWASGAIQSRAEAYQRLAEAADYLLLTEPHSPTPYLVKRAVEWGDMNLFELLQQIVRNEGEMQEIDKLLRLSGKTVTDKD